MTQPTEPSGEQQPSGEGVPPEETESTATPDGEPQKKPLSWNRILIWIGAALVALYFIGDGVIGLIKSEPSEPLPAVTSTETAADPTPTFDPVDRGETTAFGAALPDSSRQFVLTEFAEAKSWPVDGALETFRAVYTGDSDGTAVSIDVYAAQFEDAEHAGKAAESRRGTGTELESGAVTVDGTETGSFLISRAEATDQLPPVDGQTALAAGMVRAQWTNGTAMFEAYGPESELVNFYKAFGL